MRLTPTQLAARERHLRFERSIAERAEALKKSKLQLANDQMVAAMKKEIAALEPESFPAETDPPKHDPIIIMPAKEGYPRIELIQKAVCAYFRISKIDLISHRRTQDLTVPRQIGYYLCKKLTLHSLPEIGRRFGGRDHTSALHGIRHIAKLLLQNEQIAFDVAHLIIDITGEMQ